jgi:hypothetical protein
VAAVVCAALALIVGSVPAGAEPVPGGGAICPLFAPADRSVNERFGSSIGLDGEHLAVGAWLADVDELVDAGAVYAYRLDPASGDWSEAQRLTASAPEPEAGFGFAVDLDRGLLAVSAQNATAADVPAAGAVHLFELGPGGRWTETAVLTAPTPAEGDLFGYNLEVDAETETVIVGAPGSDPVVAPGPAQPVVDGGSAHVFVRSGSGRWEHQAELVDPNGQNNDRAGNDVAIAGDWAVVGHHLDDPFQGGSLSNAGGALVFRRTGTDWSRPTELLGSEPRRRDRAGIAVDIDIEPDLTEPRALVAMSGWAEEPGDRAVAWVFRYDGERWVEQARIEPERSASPGSHFGRHLELTGGLLAIGASLDAGTGLDGVGESDAEADGEGAGEPDVGTGAVHYYSEENGFWVERAKITPAGAQSGGLAGISVAVSDRWVAAGAERAALGVVNSGGACIVARDELLDGSHAVDRRLRASIALDQPVSGALRPDGEESPPLVLIGALAAGAVAVGLAAGGLALGRRRSRSA